MSWLPTAAGGSGSGSGSGRGGGGGSSGGAAASSSSTTGHRRVVSHGGDFEASPTAAAAATSNSAHQPALYGQTPSYELPTDPLAMTGAAASKAAPPAPAAIPRHRTPHQSQPSTSGVVAADAGDSHRPRGPPRKSKTIHVDTVAAGGSWKRRYEDGDVKSPASPHLTFATHRALSPHNLAGSRSGTPLARSPSPARAAGGAAAPPARQGSGSATGASLPRAAAQHLIDAGTVGGGRVSSPVMFRSPGRANSGEAAAGVELYSPSALDAGESPSDDEAEKGHGRDHSSSHHRRSFTSAHRWGRQGSGSEAHAHAHAHAHPPAAGVPIARAISRTASRGSSATANDGRKTPAKYRPSDPAPATTTTTTTTSTGSGWSSRHPHSSISIDGTTATAVTTDSFDSGRDSMAAPAAGGSPLVVPQARRGAMNLKSACESKKQRRRRIRRRRQRLLRQRSPPRPFHKVLASFISSLASHVVHPVRTAQMLAASSIATARSVDAAFRDSHGQRTWWPEWLGAYIPLLIWLGVSVTSTVVVLIFHTQVFRGLDQLSRTLRGLGFTGRMLLGSLIFLTTFPPLPLYSTLIVLCGFSFGLWQGFIISYIAALSGAIVVYLLSKSLLRGWMTGLLAKSGGLKKVVRAIEKRPKLLFLIRLAPYPYNLMNTLLASSPTLTFKTYVTCTALALPKLLVHCGLGTSIKNFAAYHGAAANAAANNNNNGTMTAPTTNSTSTASPSPPHHTSSAETVKKVAGFVGVALCIGIFLYLFAVARRAVDEELDEDSEEEGGVGARRGPSDYDALEMVSDGDDGDDSDEDDDDEKAMRDRDGDDDDDDDDDDDARMLLRGDASANHYLPPSSSPFTGLPPPWQSSHATPHVHFRIASPDQEDDGDDDNDDAADADADAEAQADLSSSSNSDWFGVGNGHSGSSSLAGAPAPADDPYAGGGGGGGVAARGAAV